MEAGDSAKKIPRNTDGYLSKNGHLTIPFPNAVEALRNGQPMNIFVKDSETKKLLGNIKIPAKK
jgi:hypothetical protein